MGSNSGSVIYTQFIVVCNLLIQINNCIRIHYLFYINIMYRTLQKHPRNILVN